MKTIHRIIGALRLFRKYRIIHCDKEGAEGGANNSDAKYTEQEVLARVEAVRRDEKAKLYDEVNGLRKAKDALSGDVASLTGELEAAKGVLTAAETDKTNLQKQYDALVASQSKEGQVDIEKLIKEVTQRASSTYEASSRKEIDTMKAELEDLRRAKRASDLERFRTEQISAAGGELIAELVRGNTEDEIRSSVEQAKEAYQKYIKKTDAGGGAPPPPPPPPPSSRGGTPPADSLAFTRPRSREEYAKNREKILAQVRERFNQ